MLRWRELRTAARAQMVRSRGEVRKLIRWPRADGVQRLRLPAESRGENRPHKPDAALSPGRCLQQQRALPQTAPQIDSLQLGAWESLVSQIPAVQPRSRTLALAPHVEISRQSWDLKREYVRLIEGA